MWTKVSLGCAMGRKGRSPACLGIVRQTCMGHVHARQAMRAIVSLCLGAVRITTFVVGREVAHSRGSGAEEEAAMLCREALVESSPTLPCALTMPPRCRARHRSSHSTSLTWSEPTPRASPRPTLRRPMEYMLGRTALSTLVNKGDDG
jgi:hypothetical protein